MPPLSLKISHPLHFHFTPSQGSQNLQWYATPEGTAMAEYACTYHSPLLPGWGRRFLSELRMGVPQRSTSPQSKFPTVH